MYIVQILKFVSIGLRYGCLSSNVFNYVVTTRLNREKGFDGDKELPDATPDHLETLTLEYGSGERTHMSGVRIVARSHGIKYSATETSPNLIYQDWRIA